MSTTFFKLGFVIGREAFVPGLSGTRLSSGPGLCGSRPRTTLICTVHDLTLSELKKRTLIKYDNLGKFTQKVLFLDYNKPKRYYFWTTIKQKVGKFGVMDCMRSFGRSKIIFSKIRKLENYFLESSKIIFSKVRKLFSRKKYIIDCNLQFSLPDCYTRIVTFCDFLTVMDCIRSFSAKQHLAKKKSK